MGPVGQVVDDFLATLGDELSTEPAVFFADQSMAFERVGWLWFSMVLAGWQVPQWILRGMLSLAKTAQSKPSAAAARDRCALCPGPSAWVAQGCPLVG